ncbi:hypothetical protein K340107D12_53010 [Blautia parvula]|uniref:Uncharacterized protein n=1 Tax=Blautia parvula TaxID=2877527 RepID=A0ABQ0C121_9FIRM
MCLYGKEITTSFFIINDADVYDRRSYGVKQGIANNIYYYPGAEFVRQCTGRAVDFGFCRIGRIPGSANWGDHAEVWLL